MALKDHLAHLFGYHAVKTTTKRNPPASYTQNEDLELRWFDRRRLVATAIDAPRNFVLCGWMLRRHLDFVSTFRFQSTTGDKYLDPRIEALMSRWARRQNCDITRRMRLELLTRFFELTRVIHGDAGLIKLNTGETQLVEGDRIAKPTKGEGPKGLSEHGLMLDEYGAVKQYCVCERDQTMLKYGRLIDAGDMEFAAYYPRADSSRGISPLAPIINQLVDQLEIRDAVLVKQKLLAFLGVVITRQAQPGGGGWRYLDDSTSATPTSTTTAYNFEIRPGLKLEMLPGDDAKILESNTPTSDFQTWLLTNSREIMAALDIPWCFWDSQKASFSAHRSELNLYLKSCEVKRNDLREVLDGLTLWKLGSWVNAGLIRLPGKMLIRDLAWEWRPTGVPWINPKEDISADVQAIGAGLKTRQQSCVERGGDYYDNIDQLAKEYEYARARNVPLTTGDPGQGSTQPAAGGDDEEDTDNDGK